MFQDSVNATGITQLYTDCCIFLVLWIREVALRMLSPHRVRDSQLCGFVLTYRLSEILNR